MGSTFRTPFPTGLQLLHNRGNPFFFFTPKFGERIKRPWESAMARRQNGKPVPGRCRGYIASPHAGRPRDDARVLANLRPMRQGWLIGYDGTLHLRNYVIVCLVKQGQGATRPAASPFLLFFPFGPRCLHPAWVWNPVAAICAAPIQGCYKPAARKYSCSPTSWICWELARGGLPEHTAVERHDWFSLGDRRDRRPLRARKGVAVAPVHTASLPVRERACCSFFAGDRYWRDWRRPKDPEGRRCEDGCLICISITFFKRGGGAITIFPVMS